MANAKLPYSEAFKQQMGELAMAGRAPGELPRAFEVCAQLEVLAGGC